MDSFPDFGNPNTFTEKAIKPLYSGKSSVGYTQTHQKDSVLKKEFTVLYKFLTKTQRETFEVFFDENQGLEFIWQNPEPSGGTHSVIFVEDVLSFKWKYPANWEVSFKIREV